MKFTQIYIYICVCVKPILNPKSNPNSLPSFGDLFRQTWWDSCWDSWDRRTQRKWWVRSSSPRYPEPNHWKNHRKTIGKWWFLPKIWRWAEFLSCGQCHVKITHFSGNGISIPPIKMVWGMVYIVLTTLLSLRIIPESETLYPNWSRDLADPRR